FDGYSYFFTGDALGRKLTPHRPPYDCGYHTPTSLRYVSFSFSRWSDRDGATVVTNLSTLLTKMSRN
ncbi:hypothetical protein ACFLZ8_04180, partial [Planctomycetota bacterium]